jgi:hypothetical protein
VDLIEYHFPQTIDKLARDRGIIRGPEPVQIQAASLDALLLYIVNNYQDTPIEFGAHQVRDPSA